VQAVQLIEENRRIAVEAEFVAKGNDLGTPQVSAVELQAEVGRARAVVRRGEADALRAAQAGIAGLRVRMRAVQSQQDQAGQRGLAVALGRHE
jgi:hypothetical protein